MSVADGDEPDARPAQGGRVASAGRPSPWFSRPLVLLTAVAGALVEFLAASREWVAAALTPEEAAGAGVAVHLTATGRQAAPAVLALVLAVLAAAAAIVLSGPRLRVALGVLLLVFALGGAAATVGLARDPASALAASADRFGASPVVVRERAEASSWVTVAAIAWILPGLAGVSTLVGGRRWPRRGSSGGTAESSERRSGPVEEVVARDGVGVWEALSRGEDPT